jgi:hypothetical protein
VARMGEKDKFVPGFDGKPGGKYHLVDVGVDGVIMLRWSLKKWAGTAWTWLSR